MNILPADETSGYFIQENRFLISLHLPLSTLQRRICCFDYLLDQVSNKDTLYIESKDKPVRLKKAVNVKTLKEKLRRATNHWFFLFINIKIDSSPSAV